MDNFDSGNNGRNGFKKAVKVFLYIILLFIVFAGGAVTYKYVIDEKMLSGPGNDDLSPAAVQVTPSQDAYNPVTPTPTQTALTPSQTDKQFLTPTPKISPTPTPRQQTQREKILVRMHKMINTKVEADFVWGEIPITEEGINKLIEEISETKFPDKDKLLTMLENWKLNDFSNAVNDHNYIWEQLGGTVGKATALRTQK